MAKTVDLFEQALAAEGISGKLADIARSIYMQESGGGRNTKTSNAGAVGGMQIIPSTFASVADKGWDINDPLHNARAGLRYIRQLDKQAGGDPVLIGAGYYGGPGGLEKARKGIAVSDPRNPNAPNTLQYGQQVAGRVGKTSAPAPVNSTGSEPQTAPVTPPEPMLTQLQVPAMEQPTAPVVSSAGLLGATEGDPWQAFLAASQAAKGVKPADMEGFGQSTPLSIPVVPKADMSGAMQQIIAGGGKPAAVTFGLQKRNKA